MNRQALRILFWNANGIQSKINELQALIIKIKIDIVLLGETKLKHNTPLKIPNFITHRTDDPLRTGRPARRGTAVLVHRRIVHRRVVLDTAMSSTSIEIAIGQDIVRISSVYKPPQDPLQKDDLNKLTEGCDWFITAGDLNSKHPLRNSQSTNPSGRTLYRHVLQGDYSIIAPDTPTHYPSTPRYRPDVLDIALIKLPQQSTDIYNLNELSSDHYPVLLNISDSPVSSSPPPISHWINWKKYNEIINNKLKNNVPQVNTPHNIDAAIQTLTDSLKSTITDCSTKITSRSTLKIPTVISSEIAEKNRLRREWQRFRDPAIKRKLNSKIAFIRSILEIHKQDKWDGFMDSINPDIKSIYKLNKKLLNKTPATHPLDGPNGPAFTADEKAELIPGTIYS